MTCSMSKKKQWPGISLLKGVTLEGERNVWKHPPWHIGPRDTNRECCFFLLDRQDRHSKTYNKLSATKKKHVWNDSEEACAGMSSCNGHVNHHTIQLTFVYITISRLNRAPKIRYLLQISLQVSCKMQLFQIDPIHLSDRSTQKIHKVSKASFFLSQYLLYNSGFQRQHH